MSTYKLVVVDADHLLLTKTRLLLPQDMRRVHDVFEKWKQAGGLAIVPDCEVVRGATIEIDLPDDFPDDEPLVPHG